MSTRAARRLQAAIADVIGRDLYADIDGLSAVAAVPTRLGRRAQKGIAVNASAYLKLCAAARIDPVDGAVTSINLPLQDLDFNRLAIKVLIELIGGCSLRKLGKAWGIEYSAINRAKNQQPVNVENFLKICKGLGCHPHEFLRRKPPDAMFHDKQSLQQIAERVGT